MRTIVCSFFKLTAIMKMYGRWEFSTVSMVICSAKYTRCMVLLYFLLLVLLYDMASAWHTAMTDLVTGMMLELVSFEYTHTYICVHMHVLVYSFSYGSFDRLL